MEEFESIHSLFSLEDICDPPTVNDWRIEEHDEEAPTQLLSAVELTSLLARAAILLEESDPTEAPVVALEPVDSPLEAVETTPTTALDEAIAPPDIAPVTPTQRAALVAWLRSLVKLHGEDLALVMLSFATVSTLFMQILALR